MNFITMVRILVDAEISLYINEYMFVYDLYKSNHKNYELTLEEINLLIDNRNREDYHRILLEIIDIDNYKDDIMNNIIRKNRIKNTFENYNYSRKIISIYKEFNNSMITYEILNKILNKSLIIQLNTGNYLIKFEDVKLSAGEINRIIDNDYKNETCMICLETMNNFRLFNCCFSKICRDCFHTNNYKCPICNQQSKTLISY